MGVNQLSKAAAEAIGTFALVFLGCGSIMIAERFPGAMPPGAIPVVFGLVVAAMIYAVGHISGAHFNPAVTLGFAVARHFPWRDVVLYWIAQVFGACLAVSVLHFTLPTGVSYGATTPHLPFMASFIWEAILTFFLMFIIIAVATDTRAVGVMAGVAIGAAVTLGAFVGGPLTGASMNPARSFAPALFEKDLSHMGLYFLAPCAGAVVAALIYERIRCAGSGEVDEKKSTETQAAKGCC